jgi:hypothetical protein
MNPKNRIVFLVDVDDTLLDNDLAQQEYLQYITSEFGQHAAKRYWNIFQEERLILYDASYG